MARIIGIIGFWAFLYLNFWMVWMSSTLPGSENRPVGYAWGVVLICAGLLVTRTIWKLK